MAALGLEDEDDHSIFPTNNSNDFSELQLRQMIQQESVLSASIDMEDTMGDSGNDTKDDNFYNFVQPNSNLNPEDTISNSLIPDSVRIDLFNNNNNNTNTQNHAKSRF